MWAIPFLACNCIILLIETTATDGRVAETRITKLMETIRYRRSVNQPPVRNQDTEKLKKIGLGEEMSPQRRQRRTVQNQLFKILKNRKNCWYAIKDYARCYNGVATSDGLKQDRYVEAAGNPAQKPKTFWITGRKRSVERQWQRRTVIDNNMKRSSSIERWEGNKPAMKLIWGNIAQIMNEGSPRPIKISPREEKKRPSHNDYNNNDQQWEKRYKPFWITGKKRSTSS